MFSKNELSSYFIWSWLKVSSRLKFLVRKSYFPIKRKSYKYEFENGFFPIDDNRFDFIR